MIALLTNPESGVGEAESVGAILSTLTETVEFPVDAIDEALDAGAKRLVVAGGDGSIAPAAWRAARAGVPIAVLPTGTANDFARALGIPNDLDQACRIASQGTRTRAIDVGVINERPFLNVASIGLPPVAAIKAGRLKRIFGPLAYSVGAIWTGLTKRPIPCRVFCDGIELHEGAAWQVSVGITGAFGGGSELDAEAPPDTGTLDVVVLPGGTRGRLLGYAYGLKSGRIKRQHRVRSRVGRSVTIALGGETAFNVDGEVVQYSSSRINIEPGAVEVIVG